MEEVAASAHRRRVLRMPTLPSARLPATVWAVPGRSRLRAMSHQALRRMTSRLRGSGLRSGWTGALTGSLGGEGGAFRVDFGFEVAGEVGEFGGECGIR